MRRTRPWIGVLAVAVTCALAGACGGKSVTASRDAGADASHDAGADADACADTPESLTVCCSMSVAEACKKYPGCILKWPANPLAFCSGMYEFSTWDCGGYHVVQDDTYDMGSLLYYDIQSGDLVVIDNWTDCMGPARFTRPRCSKVGAGFDCSDAGSDAAADTGSADAGSDAAADTGSADAKSSAADGAADTGSADAGSD